MLPVAQRRAENQRERRLRDAVAIGRSRFVANTKSAEKMIKVAEKKRLRNRSIKSAVKTYIRKAERGIVAASEESPSLVVLAISKLDKAASKGVLHKRNAARRKSRLMKKLNAAAAAS
jgi:small subunit ribosomal protein S20